MTKNKKIDDIKSSEEQTLNKSNSKLFIILTTLFFIIISFSAYYVFTSNPKRIFMLSVSSFNRKLNNVYHKTNQNYFNKLTMNGTFHMNVDFKNNEQEEYTNMNQFLKNLNQTNFKYEYKQDITAKKLYFQLIPVLNNEKITEMNYYNENNNQYLLIDEVAKEYLKLEQFPIFEMITNQKIDDYNYIMNIIKDSVFENLKEKEFISSDVKIKLDGKEQAVKKIELSLDEKRIQENLNKVIDDLQQDKKANNILTKLYPEFHKYKNESVDDKNSSVFHFIIYTKKLSNEPLKYAFTITDSYTKKEIGLAFTDGKTKELEFIQNEKVIYTLEITGNEEKFQFELKDNKGNRLGYVKGNIQTNKISFEAWLELNKDIKMNYQIKLNQENEKTTSKMKMIIQNHKNEELLSIELDDEHTSKEEVNMNIDTENSRKFTEEDAYKLITWIKNVISNYVTIE